MGTATATAPAPAPDRPSLLLLGSHGPAVTALQRALIAHGYGDLLEPWYADGDFSPATEDAVRAFQCDHGLTPDGVVGPATRALLLP